MEPGISQSNIQAGWSCPKCGTVNNEANRYCQQCSTERFSSPSGQIEIKNSRSGRIIAAAVIFVIVFAGISGGGYYIWHTTKQKEITKKYLELEGKAFGNIISEINGLSTEKDISEDGSQDDNLDLFIKKIEEENAKAEKAVSEIRVTKEKNTKAAVSKQVAGIDSLLKNYYKDLEAEAVVYASYMSYGLAVVREDKIFTESTDKIDVLFKNAKTLEEISSSLKAIAKAVEDSSQRIKNVTPPEGLEEAHNKGIAEFDKAGRLFSELAAAIDSKSLTKVAEKSQEVDDFFNDPGSFKAVDDLNKYYFDQMHNKFVSLRQRADGIRQEMIKSGAASGVEVPGVSIEGW